MEFRKKSTERIKAIQWDGTFLGTVQISDSFPDLNTMSKDWHSDGTVSRWRITTFFGVQTVNPNDWIIKPEAGAFCICDNVTFRNIWEPIPEDYDETKNR